MQPAQPSIAFIYLAGFPDTGLEIIAFYRQIIIIPRSPGFLKGCFLSLRIDAAVVHIISQQIGPAAQHTERLGFNIFRPGISSSVRGWLQPAAKLCGQIRISADVKGKLPALLSLQIGTDIFILFIGRK